MSVSLQPYRYLNGEGHGIVCEHEALKRLMAEFVIADRRNDERSSIGRCVLSDIDDGVGGVGKGCVGL